MPTYRRQDNPRLAIARRILVTEETAELPGDTIEHRSLVCPHHVEPLPMQAIGESLSASGDVIVLYACSDQNCRYREAFGTDARSGKPRRMIRGCDQSRG